MHSSGTPISTLHRLLWRYGWTRIFHPLRDAIDLETTPPPVESTTPSDDETDVEVNTAIALTFSESTNQTTTDDSFGLKKDTMEIEDNFTRTTDGKTLSFIPAGGLEEGADRQVVIATTAKDSSGNTFVTTRRSPSQQRNPNSQASWNSIGGSSPYSSSSSRQSHIDGGKDEEKVPVEEEVPLEEETARGTSEEAERCPLPPNGHEECSNPLGRSRVCSLLTLGRKESVERSY